MKDNQVVIINPGDLISTRMVELEKIACAYDPGTILCTVGFLKSELGADFSLDNPSMLYEDQDDETSGEDRFTGLRTHLSRNETTLVERVEDDLADPGNVDPLVIEQARASVQVDANFIATKLVLSDGEGTRAQCFITDYGILTVCCLEEEFDIVYANLHSHPGFKQWFEADALHGLGSEGGSLTSWICHPDPDDLNDSDA